MCLTFFMQHDVFKVHLCNSTYQYFILFYGWIIMPWWICLSLFIHWAAGEHLCSFHFWLIMLLWTFIYKLSEDVYIIRSWTAESFGSCVQFVEWFSNCFHISCMILCSHQQCVSIPIFPQNLQHWLVKKN